MLKKKGKMAKIKIKTQVLEVCIRRPPKATASFVLDHLGENSKIETAAV